MQYSQGIKIHLNFYKKIFAIFITGCIIVVLVTSCGPRVQKPDDAFTIVKKERMLSDDSSFVSKEVIQASMKTEPVKKTETVDEWTKFRLETEKKIRQNANNIQKIKDMPNQNANTRKKLTNLEKDNNNLKMSLNEYPEEVNAKWVAFKSSMSHNANEIGIELNALITDQKK
jgi:hypothetical protein